MSYTSEYTPILCPITNVLHIRVYTNIMSHHQCLTHQSIHQYYVPSPMSYTSEYTPILCPITINQ
jgi:hypothetical protein